MVKEGWNIQIEGSPLFQISQKLKSIKCKLRTIFGRVDKQKDNLCEEIFKVHDARRLNPNDVAFGEREREKAFTKEYIEDLDLE